MSGRGRVDAYATRRAANVAAQLVRRSDPEYGAHCQSVLADRPLALESPTPALTALTNRVVAYMEAAAERPPAAG
mgnify:FL=1